MPWIVTTVVVARVPVYASGMQEFRAGRGGYQGITAPSSTVSGSIVSIS